MTEHTPKVDKPSDVDWEKIAPPMMVHVDHDSAKLPAPSHLSVVTPRAEEEPAGPGMRFSAPSASLSPSSAQDLSTNAMVHVDHREVGMVHVDHHEHYSQILELPLDRIDPNPRQPRKFFDESELEDLASSISTTGVLQPVVVREAGQGRWQIIMGERRLRASRLAGKETIPAILREVPDEKLLQEAIIENIQRAELNPIEEALALQALLDDWGVNQEEVGLAVGKSRISVSHSLGLLRLPEEVQMRVASGVISKGHAKVLMGIEDPFIVKTLADRIVTETLSVRGLEEAVLFLDPAIRNKPRRGRSRQRRATYPEMEEAFEELLETKVKIEGSTKRGRVLIEFSGAEDLKRICDVLGVKALK